ncbi:hypothetical protein H6F56_17360 [Microcoleus sp. FACHB-672]|nr:hypothetical protein [Microcoleus sp. FACHB-672]
MLAFALEKEINLPKSKARSLASHFADLQEFLNVEASDLTNIRSISGQRTIRLTSDEVERILAFKSTDSLSAQLTVAENFLACISRNFTRKQLAMIRILTLENLNPNPFLIKALNLKTPEEVVRLNVYMAGTRSIVTSMGFFLQDILLSSSDTVENAPKNSGWDLIKKTDSGELCWIQVKSGPNNMDKDQIVYWALKIQEKINAGDKAYIGITYGKRSNKTVTMGLLKQFLPEWEMKTLIGRELWDFISEDPGYSSQLFEILRTSAAKVLQEHSISDALEVCVQRITNEFISKYGGGSLGVSNYIAEIF